VGNDLLGLKSGRAEYLKDRGVISEHEFVTRRAWEDWGCVLDGHGQEGNASWSESESNTTREIPGL
jgi:hypothetical protein